MERKLFFIDTYIDKQTGKTICSSFIPERQGQPVDIQGSYVLPLAFNIVEGELRQKLVDNLVACIEREDTTDDGVRCPSYSLMTGFITTAWISRVLSDNGRSDVAYRLLQQTDYPSWLYPVTQGATTIWERLNSYTHTNGFGGNNSMNSFNHYSFGAVGQWLINRCLGIERDEQQPGFRHFFLRPEPDPTGMMTYARGHLDTSYGRIESSWHINADGTVGYHIVIPDSISATLYLPGEAPQEITKSYDR
jgi:alpha-L-rhamnosidase